MLYFFLSYARGSDDIYVRKFFDDLCVEVRLIAGLQQDAEVGFLDNESIEAGDVWAAALIEALSRCRSFLPLCSPRFFQSEPCGREWAIFEERIRRHEEIHRNRPSTLIPLRWLPLRNAPSFVTRLQYFVEPQLNGQQANSGVRQLMRLTRNQDDYLVFVTQLANRIVDAAHDDPMQDASDELDWHSVPSMFPLPAELTVPPRVNAHPVASSANRVHFVVSAPTAGIAGRAPVGRSDISYYGADPTDWAPYRPQSREPIAEYAAQVAIQANLESQVISVDHLDETLAEARVNNQVVVILVDAWSTRIPANREILQRYDDRGERPAAIMIPVNSTDDESHQNDQALTESVRATFPNNWAQQENSRFHRRVLDLTNFEPELQMVLAESQNRIFADPVIRRPLPPVTAERPILEGP
ncbi:TIR-like protein FxsC [Actinoplanes sp. NPDC026619]|uniref:TIR-like protein FxsC n=1 Tax=Actinoplanes sp. NPDC026619 TaxID=3155798 RepID=UPI0033FEB6D5